MDINILAKTIKYLPTDLITSFELRYSGSDPKMVCGFSINFKLDELYRFYIDCNFGNKKAYIGNDEIDMSDTENETLKFHVVARYLNYKTEREYQLRKFVDEVEREKNGN